MNITSKPRVLITGVSGYLGSYICKTFLEHGGFNVRGTVRSLVNERKIQPLRDGYGEDLFSQLELVEADLMNEQSIMTASEGCDYIVHTASPMCDAFTVFENEDEFIKPAVDGTLAVMKAAHKNKVKKVVITSSTAAIAGADPEVENGKIFTEEDWTDIDTEGLPTYFKSKTLAERAAWDFLADLPDDEKMPLVAINPSIIIGPNVSTGSSESIQVGKSLLLGEFPMFPKRKVSFADIRDVSRAHLEAVLRDEADNKRFILCAGAPDLIEFAKALEEKFGKDYPIKAREMPKILPMIMRFWSSEMAMIYKGWGQEYEFNGNRAAEILGIHYIGVEKSTIDMGESLIATGCVEDKRTAQVVA